MNGNIQYIHKTAQKHIHTMIKVLTCRSMDGWPERLSPPYLDEQQL